MSPSKEAIKGQGQRSGSKVGSKVRVKGRVQRSRSMSKVQVMVNFFSAQALNIKVGVKGQGQRTGSKVRVKGQGQWSRSKVRVKGRGQRSGSMVEVKSQCHDLFFQCTGYNDHSEPQFLWQVLTWYLRKTNDVNMWRKGQPNPQIREHRPLGLPPVLCYTWVVSLPSTLGVPFIFGQSVVY